MISFEHYFDWAGTAPADTEIQEEALKYSFEHWGNPSSIHEAGSDAKKALEECRSICARELGVKSETIFFTSGGTESDHIPLLSVLNRPQKGSILISAIEHPAVREMARMMKNTQWDIITVNPDKDGIVKSENIVKNLREDTVFVSVMAVNNETGAIQDIYKIADELEKIGKNRRKPHFHVDCVQAAGKIPLNLNYPGIDSAAFSAHKLGGPRGTGILYLKKEIVSFLRGGGQEKNIRSGTENIFGARAMALCLEKSIIREDKKDVFERYLKQKKWTKNFIKGLLSIKGVSIIPESRKGDEDEPYSPWVVQSSIPGIPGQVMVRALSAEGYYISTGSACSAGKNSRPVLDSMNISAEKKESAVRFSFGKLTSEKAMNELLEKVREIAKKFAH